MYMRLWWKDARQFWPIWGFLVLVAMAGEALIVHYGSDEVRNSTLGLMAVGCAGLYAFAVGSAAFAGERETGTLRLLDVLPAPRRTVWAGKVSFGLVSILAMMLLLLGLATMGAAHPPELWRVRGGGDPLPLAVALLQGFAWGLFFSSMLESALVAAVAAILMTTFTAYGVASRHADPYRAMQVNALVALALAALSWIAFLWARRRRFRSFGLEIRSPIVVTGAGAMREASRSPVPPVEAEMSPTAAAVLAPAHAIAAPGAGPVIPTAAWSADQPRPRSTFTEFL
ncbi:MAG: ABC transporter permease subunit, partial [Isosphaeraceae bacterium]